MVVIPGCATVKIGGETFTSTDKLTTKARHLVVLKALNETRYRYTNIPGALRQFIAVDDKQSELTLTKDKTQSNEGRKVSQILKQIISGNDEENMANNAVKHAGMAGKSEEPWFFGFCGFSGFSGHKF